MENNRISIDDLVKQRFADREEPLPAGAWTRMEGLLEKQMPPVPVSRFGKGRQGLFLLLLASLGATGGYQLWQQAPAASPAEKALAEQTSVGAPQVGVGPANIAQNTPLTTPSSPTTNTASSPSVGEEVISESHNAPATPAERSQNTSTVVPDRTLGLLAPSNPAPVVAGRKAASLPASSVAQHIPSSVAAKSESSDIPVKPTAPVPVAVVAGSSVAVASASPSPVPVREEIVRLQPALRNYGIKSAVRPQSLLSMNRLGEWMAQLQNTYRSGLKVMDELAVSVPVVTGAAQTVLQNPVVVAPNEVISGNAPAVASTAASTTLMAPDSVVGPLVDRFQQATRMVGILAGINSSFGGSGALQGLHLGAFRIMPLSGKWSLGTELRYFLRINNSLDLQDDYYQTRATNEATVLRNGVNYHAVRYDTDSTLSRYRFTYYHSLELPVYVQYNQGRVGYYGGVNAGLHIRPAIAHTNTKIATISRYDTLAPGEALQLPPSREAEMQATDFDTRFSLGAFAGMQYRITPALHLDLRLTKNLWDHRQGQSAGALRVSQTYLRPPSVQLSVGYNLLRQSPRISTK